MHAHMHGHTRHAHTRRLTRNLSSQRVRVGRALRCKGNGRSERAAGIAYTQSLSRLLALPFNARGTAARPRHGCLDRVSRSRLLALLPSLTHTHSLAHVHCLHTMHAHTHTHTLTCSLKHARARRTLARHAHAHLVCSQTADCSLALACTHARAHTHTHTLAHLLCLQTAAR